jgi:hypothetical protein
LLWNYVGSIYLLISRFPALYKEVENKKNKRRWKYVGGEESEGRNCKKSKRSGRRDE